MTLKKIGIIFIIIGLTTSLILIPKIHEAVDFDLTLVFTTVGFMVLTNLGLSLIFFDLPYSKRKKIALLGLIVGLIILSMAWFFKHQHWQGAGFLIIVGVLFLCFAYMPLLVRNRYEKWKTFMDLTWHLRFLCIGDLISIILLLAGALSKIQHWPGGSHMIISGSISLACTIFGWNQIFKQVVQKRKEAEDKLALAFNELNKKHHVIEEKQKEILDSIHYAKRIQSALLPSKKQIHRNLNRLNKND